MEWYTRQRKSLTIQPIQRGFLSCDFTGQLGKSLHQIWAGLTVQQCLLLHQAIGMRLEHLDQEPISTSQN